MKINQEKREFVSNITNSEAFKIDTNAKVFEMFYSKIYEHKIAAIVRELSSNAYDSHVEAGKVNEPFSVVLPNALYPYFEIEDFGVGMDDDDVTQIFTTYGASSKNLRNDLVGGLGIGAKSPFSYTDSFYIHTRKNGVEYAYTAFLDEGNIPQLSRMGTRKTDKPNGVKIKIEVKKADFEQFEEESKFILSLFVPHPIVTYGESVDQKPFPFSLTEDEVRKIKSKQIAKINPKPTKSALYRISENVYNKPSFVLMGNICYPIKLVDFIETGHNPILNKISRSHQNDYYFINFDIGQLDFAVSRESLSYDVQGKTKQLITQKLIDVTNEIWSVSKEKLEKSNSVIDAIRLISEDLTLSSDSGHSTFGTPMLDLNFYIDRYKGSFLKYYKRCVDAIYDRYVGPKNVKFYINKASSYGNRKISNVNTPDAIREAIGNNYYSLFLDNELEWKIYYSTSKKPERGQLSHIRLNYDNKRCKSLFMIIREPLSEYELDALKNKLFKGLDRVEFIDYTKLKTREREETKQKSKKTPLNKDSGELYATGILAYNVHTQVLNTLRHIPSDNLKSVYYFEGKSKSDLMVAIKKFKIITNNYDAFITKKHHNVITFILKTSKNAKKIQNLNIPHWEQFHKNEATLSESCNLNDFKNMIVSTKLRDEGILFERNKFRYFDEDLNWYTHSGLLSVLNKYFNTKEMNEELHQRFDNNVSTSYSFQDLLPDIYNIAPMLILSKRVLDKLNEKADKIINYVKSVDIDDYPMLKYAKVGLCDYKLTKNCKLSEEQETELIEYLDICNQKHKLLSKVS